MSIESGICNLKHGALSGGGSYFVFTGSHFVGKLVLWQIAFCGVRMGEAAVPGPSTDPNMASDGGDVVEDILNRLRDEDQGRDAAIASAPPQQIVRMQELSRLFINAEGKAGGRTAVQALLRSGWDVNLNA